MTDASGSTIVLSSGLDDITFPRDVDMLEVTTFGDDDRVYIPGLRGASFSVSGHFSSTHAIALDGLLGHSTDSGFDYSPESTSTGRQQYTGNVFLENLEYGTPVDGKANLSATFRITGPVASTSH